MNKLGLRSAADFRALFHVVAPALAIASVSSGWVDDNRAHLILTLLLVVSQASVATFKAATAFRKWLYAVVGAAGAVLVAFDFFDQMTWDTWSPIVLLLISGGVAAVNTNTTKDYELAG